MRTFIALVGVCALLAAAPEPQSDLTQVITAYAQRETLLKSSTFDIHVEVALKTFPWLKFTLIGKGEYERPGAAKIHFTKVPWFGKGYETVPLDALDPKTWPDHYTIVSAVPEADGATTLVLHDRKKSPLREMRATLDAASGVHALSWSYSYGGKIVVKTTSQQIDGQPFPQFEDADIIMPTVHAVAHAEFTNYHVVVDAPAGAPSGSPAPTNAPSSAP